MSVIKKLFILIAAANAITVKGQLTVNAVVNHAATTSTASVGNITLNVGGGTPPYSYSWSPGGATSKNINGVMQNNYSVTVTDASRNTLSYTYGLGYKTKWVNLHDMVFRNDSMFMGSHAVSKNTLLANTDGWAEIALSSNTGDFLLGFIDSLDINHDTYDVDFGFYSGAGALYSQFNSNYGSGAYTSPNDVIRIERLDTMFYLKLNGAVVASARMPKVKNFKLKMIVYNDPQANIGASFMDSTGIYFANYVRVKPYIKHSTGLDVMDGSITLTSMNGDAGNTYSWTAGGRSYTTSTLADMLPGTYNVTVKDANNNTSRYSYDVLYKARLDNLDNVLFYEDSLINHTYGWGTAVNDGVLEQNQDGAIEWVVPDLTTLAMVGFAQTTSTVAGDYADIDHGFFVSDHILYYTQNGSFSFMGYCYPGDVIKMNRDTDTLDFYLNNRPLSSITVTNTGVDWKIKTALAGGYANISAANIGVVGPGFIITKPPTVGTPDSQFNWHLEETYDENGVVISSQKTYMDNLGRDMQDLSKNADGNVFASQSVYDSYGRPAISSMAAYVGTSLVYQPWFMRTTTGQPYAYNHFDTPATLNNPVALTTSMNNMLGNYYSNGNTYDAYQATADNPYTRVEYTGDPGGNQRRVSKVGTAFKMGSGRESYSFSMISGDELKYVYGNNFYYKSKRDPGDYNNSIPLTTAGDIVATKQIMISPDNIESVSYSVGGKVLATCYAGLSPAESCTYTANNKMSYYGTKSTDIHLPDANKGELYLPLPWQDPTNISSATPSGSIIMTVTDLYTDNILLAGVDYSLAFNRNVQFDAGFLSLYTGRSLMLRISYAYTPAYETYLLTYSAFPPADAVATYSLNYGRFSKNYYDVAGALRKSVSPKGFGCSTPTVITMATTYDYNHKGQLIAKTSPDEGLVEMTYDKEGRLRFTQNAEQKLNDRFSYVNYDKHARPYESGEYQSVNLNLSAWFTNYYMNGTPYTLGVTTAYIMDEQDGLLPAQKTNTTVTSYAAPTSTVNDIPTGYTYYSQYQNFREGQVNYIKNKNSTVWFNYDKVGRKTATITQITESDFVAKTPNVDARIKTSESTYNYFNGLSTSYTWQPNNTNEIVKYAYTYNANYQPTLTTMAYGTVTAQNLQASTYNLMGQLKRVVTGYNYQGTDYVYNLNGGLKAINHPGLDASLDPGADNSDYSGSTPSYVNKDLFGEILEHYNDDYVRTGTGIGSSITPTNSIYNGLLHAVRFKTRNAVNTTTTGANYIDYMGSNQVVIPNASYLNEELAFKYTYDEFNQLATSTFNQYNNSSNTYTARTEYAETGASGGNIAYDRNGNITRLVRQAYSSNVLDNLTYTVGTNNNKLTNILDAASYTTATNFKTPSTSTASAFSYNSIGQLTVSAAESVTLITYYPDGKVKRIGFSNSNYTEYEYGAGGEKLKSKFYNSGANKIKYTWYIGPMLYEWDEATANTFNIAEVTIPGGVIRVNAQATVGISGGYPVYHVTDHLGNVRVTYKSNGTGNGIDVLSFNDYYAFGGQLPGRTWASGGDESRYGYQGQEKATAGNPWYQFELRMYNQDIGRWFAPDPYGQFSSPYIGMANNPVSAVDPDGGWVNMGGESRAAKEKAFRRENHLDEFSFADTRKRYLNELKNLKEHFLDVDYEYDYDKYFAAVQTLNAFYMGLGGLNGDILSGSYLNGTEQLTMHEIIINLDNVKATNLAIGTVGQGAENGFMNIEDNSLVGDDGWIMGSNGYDAQERERDEITGKAQESRDAYAKAQEEFKEGVKAMNAGIDADKQMDVDKRNSNLTNEIIGDITQKETVEGLKITLYKAYQPGYGGEIVGGAELALTYTGEEAANGRWVQTVTSSIDNGGKPYLDNEGTGSIYYDTKADAGERINGNTISFYDGPGRLPSKGPHEWRGFLTLYSNNKPVFSVRWGYSYSNNKYSTIPYTIYKR